MKYPKAFATMSGVVTLFALFATAANAQSVHSPSGKIGLELSQSPDLEYTVEAFDDLVIRESAIRIELGDGHVLGRNSTVLQVSQTSQNETWEPVVKGRRERILNAYNEIKVDLLDHSLRDPQKSYRYSILVRAFDDGIAFKYVIPKPKGWSFNSIREEKTEFTFHGNPECWAADFQKMKSHQEAPFTQQTIRDLGKNAIIGSPLLVKLNKGHGYAAVTEGALVDFAAFYLERGEQPLYYSNVVTKLSRHRDQPLAVVSDGTIESSWRVIMLSPDLNGLFQNDIILNLNEPCEIEDPSWIEPGIMAWDHWWSGEVKMDTATIKQYIKLAADMGWKYQLIDWQWYGPFNNSTADITTVTPTVDMDEVKRFAKAKGVDLWLWLYWKDVERNEAFKKAFPLYKKWGIKGIKIDFMQRDDQWMVNWYHKIVKAAADNELMVDFHGAYKPTGWRRTYPNLMTREGVMGQEYSKWSEFITPEHNCTIMYTRNLLGEVDFTPGGFLNRTSGSFVMAQQEGGRTQVMGTRAHNLALFVIYESPITVVPEYPDNIRGEPGSDLLTHMPTIWDETILLEGEIGKYGVMAKRSGKDWYIGGITNENSRALELDLSFLDPDKTYQIKMWTDGPNAETDATDLSIVTKHANVSKTSLKMASGGGFVIHFKAD